MPQAVLGCIAPADRVKVKFQVRRNRRNIVAQLMHIHTDLHRYRPAGDCQHMDSHIVGFVGPGIKSLHESKVIDHCSVHGQRYGRRRCGRIIDHISDPGGVILTGRDLSVMIVAVCTADDRQA